MKQKLRNLRIRIGVVIGRQLERKLKVAATLIVGFILLILVGGYALWQRDLANEKEQFADRLLYAVTMNLAATELSELNFTRARDLLNLYLPASNTKNYSKLRNFYWYYLWRQSHQELATLKGHAGYDACSLAGREDAGDLGGDNTVKLWDVRTRQELVTLKGHDEDVLSVAFHPTGRY